MNLFLTHLWKEWREIRFVLAFLASTTLVFAIAAVEATVRMQLPQLGLPATLGLIAAATGVLVMGGELLGKDLAAERRTPIRRLPGSLALPFAIRVGIYFTAIVVLGLLAGVSTDRLLHWRTTTTLQLEIWPHAQFRMLFVIGATWTLAASCWVRQGMLAAPAALAMIVVLGLPLLVPIDGQEMAGYLTANDATRGAIALAIGGLMAAWLAFRVGVQHGSRSRTVAIGMTTLLVSWTPLYATAGYRVHRFATLDPNDADFQISNAFVSSDGRTLHVAAGRYPDRWPGHVFAVDVATGAWRTLGTGFLTPVALSNHAPGGASGVPLDLLFHTLVTGQRIVDASTGAELVADHDFLASDPPAVLDRLRAERRRTTPIRLDDGRRAWFLADHMEIGQATGDDIEVRTLDPNERIHRPCARGYFYFQLIGQTASMHYRDIRGGWTLALEPGSASNTPISTGLLQRGRHGGYRIVGPDGPHDTDLPSRQDDVYLALDDDQLLVGRLDTTQNGAPIRHLERLDLASGARTPLRFDDGSPALGSASQGSKATTPAGKHIVHVLTHGQYRLARLDGDTLTLARAPVWHGPLVGSLDEDSAILISGDSHRIERVHFGSDALEVLFPRPAP